MIDLNKDQIKEIAELLEMGISGTMVRPQVEDVYSMGRGAAGIVQQVTEDRRQTTNGSLLIPGFSLGVQPTPKLLTNSALQGGDKATVSPQPLLHQILRPKRLPSST
jgi:hypothetical protein